MDLLEAFKMLDSIYDSNKLFEEKKLLEDMSREEMWARKKQLMDTADELTDRLKQFEGQVDQLNVVREKARTAIKGLIPLTPSISYSVIRNNTRSGQETEEVKRTLNMLLSNAQGSATLTGIQSETAQKLVSTIEQILSEWPVYSKVLEALGLTVGIKQFNQILRDTQTTVKDYLDNYSEYDKLYDETQAAVRRAKEFKIPRAKSLQDKEVDIQNVDIIATAEAKARANAAGILQSNWYALGWLAKHITKLAFTCRPEDLTIWQNALNDSNIANRKPAGARDRWGWVEEITGTIVFDTNPTQDVTVSSYLKNYVQIANDQKNYRSTLVNWPDTANPKQINSWWIVRDLVRDFNFQLSLFTQAPIYYKAGEDGYEEKSPTKIKSYSIKYNRDRQDPNPIRALAKTPEEQKDFDTGYNT